MIAGKGRAFRWAAVLCAALAAASHGVAQNSAKPTLAAMQRQLADKKQELLRREAEYQRCTDLIIGFHLGIAGDVDKTFELRGAERDRPREALEKDLAENLEAVSGSGAELERLRATLTALREEIAARPPAPPENSWVGATPAEQHTGEVAEPPADPTVAAELPEDETKAPQPAPAPASETAQPTTLIRGSTDHRQLGVAFYHAGMYEKALHELEQAAAPDDAPLSVMFYLARTYEKLADLARADSEFLRIEGLDESRGAGGGWAAAARTARQHMSWMRDHADWRAPTLAPAKRK